MAEITGIDIPANWRTMKQQGHPNKYALLEIHKMIEVTFSYDFLPKCNQGEYANVAHKATAMMVKADGFIEFRAHRNLLGSPHVRRTSVWQSLAQWAAFAEQPEFQAITEEFRLYVTNIDVQLWGPSPISPDPIRPASE